MPFNDPEYQRKYRKKHYEANKQKYIDKAKVVTAKLYDEICELKNVPCMDCGGIFNHWQMDFDHRPDEEKTASVSNLIARGSRKVIFKEIDKCDIVCSNCHRERTWQRIQVSKHASVV